MSVINVSAAGFKSQVLDNQDIVFVDFYADWCGPCKMTEPIITALAEEYAGKTKFVKVNVDHNQEIASQYNVFSIPTFIIFKQGKPQNQFVGAMGKEGFVRELKKVLGD